jgi:two-component system phosphate regulon sensor histidine kinase PhoR
MKGDATRGTRRRRSVRVAATWLALYAGLAVISIPIAVFVFDLPAGPVTGGVVGAGLLGLLAAAAAAALQARRWSEPLEALSQALSQISTGEFTARLPAGSRHMVDELAASLDRVQDYLQVRFAELEASREQWRTALDSMLEGVIAIDASQKVVLLNEAARQMFRITPPQVAGRDLFELVRHPKLAEWVAAALEQGGAHGGEFDLLSPAPRTLAVRVASLATSEPGGAVIVASDISQLRRLEKVRQEFVANASHELKTPLASIKACVETLLDGALGDAEVRVNFLQIVNEQTERLDRLVRDLLALTRLESQAGSLELAPIDLARVVTTVVDRHRQNAERKQIDLVVEAPAEPVSVLGDTEGVEQILDNLVDNAIKYTNAGGRATVQWRVAGDRCQIDVADTGIGIPAAHLERIFERFYRVDRARSRELGGTGLGLSIVRHAALAQGGAVSVKSRLGSGSVFTVELRLAR